jgi:23S rRNA (uracil1939-C5)-methyltransferase
MLARALPSAEQVSGASSLWGSSSFDARFAGYRYHLAPLTFFQVNEGAAELLVEQVLALLAPLAGRSVLDLYAGAGTFSVPIAAQAKQVLAVESDPAAIADADQTARANGLANLHVAPGQVEDELPGLPRHAADAAVLDPPRAGLSAAVIDELARIDIPRIVYVSCDPATLARDLRRFMEQGYHVETIQPIDLFPQTYHIEIVVALSRA